MSKGGSRSRTRDKFSKDFRKHGMPNPSTYLHVFKKGDYVDIKVDSSIQKGMPYHHYHGCTGRVFNVNPRSIGVLVKRTHGCQSYEKRLHIRCEHLRLNNWKAANSERIKQFQQGLISSIEVPPLGPRSAFEISFENNVPVKLKFDPFIERF